MMVTLRLVRIYPGWNPKLGFGLDSDPTDYPNRYRMGINYNIADILLYNKNILNYLKFSLTR